MKIQRNLKNTGPASIQIEMQEFSQKELSWWASYGITKDILKKFRVYSCKSVFLNGNYFASSSEQSPIYGYYKGKRTDWSYGEFIFLSASHTDSFLIGLQR